MKSKKLNQEVRQAIVRKGLCHYEVARALNVSQFTFSHWLQNELPAERRESILKAIENMN